MIGKITEESMRLIADEIIDEIAENTHFGREDSRAIIQRILESNGIVEVIPDQGWKHPTLMQLIQVASLDEKCRAEENRQDIR